MLDNMLGVLKMVELMVDLGYLSVLLGMLMRVLVNARKVICNYLFNWDDFQLWIVNFQVIIQPLHVLWLDVLDDPIPFLGSKVLVNVNFFRRNNDMVMVSQAFEIIIQPFDVLWLDDNIWVMTLLGVRFDRGSLEFQSTLCQ